MSGNSIVLDTNIVIYLSQKKLTIDAVFSESKEYTISIITYMEVLSYHFPTREEKDFMYKLLSLFQIIDINQTIADEVIRLKKMRKIKLPDAIIVATALQHHATLYTNDKQLHTIATLNIKHFDD
jgi:predicted nucleic acid-binding protein